VALKCNDFSSVINHSLKIIKPLSRALKNGIYLQRKVVVGVYILTLEPSEEINFLGDLHGGERNRT
jgi:hypothetical protein